MSTTDLIRVHLHYQRVTVIEIMEHFIDEDTAQKLSSRLEEFANTMEHPLFIVNLRHVHGMPSIMLGGMLAFRKALLAAGGRFALAEPDPRVAELLRESSLDQLFEVFDDEKRAIKALSGD